MKKNKSFKGFTLIELIIVMAIFSVLLVGAIRLVDPVGKIFRSASNTERAYSYTNTVQNYLEDSLKYAENINVYQGIADETALINAVETYRKGYFEDIVKYDGTNLSFVEGKIRVLCLHNASGDVGYDTDGTAISSLPVGQITLREIDFKSDTPITSISSQNVVQLNNNYFSQNGAKYLFKYALGTNELKFETSDTLYMLRDKNDTDPAIANPPVKMDDMVISIIAAKLPKSGTIASKESDSTSSYLVFDSPCSLTTASLPLMNINSRSGEAVSRMYQKSTIDPVLGKQYTTDIAKQDVSMMYPSFVYNAGTSADPIDLNQDIYFIYSYTDELELS